MKMKVDDLSPTDCRKVAKYWFDEMYSM